jgi:heat shock protein HslJ
MNRPLVIGFSVVIFLAVIAAVLFSEPRQDVPPSESSLPEVSWLQGEEKNVVRDPKNATYIIDGTPVTLVDGVSESEIPGSAAKVVTRYFGNELVTDMNGDGREDIALYLTRNQGGSGTFYYLVVAMATEEGGYAGSHAVFLGDRIAPQPTSPGTGARVVVNFAERAKGEPFSTPPSVGKSMAFIFDPATMQLGEVVTDFEGEADPSRMTLSMKTWNWVSASTEWGTVVTPKQEGKFTLTFREGENFSATTDCNGVGGAYVATKEKLTFGAMMSTQMYCEGSQEQEFIGMLAGVSAYHFTGKGELVLLNPTEKITMIFR